MGSCFQQVAGQNNPRSPAPRPPTPTPPPQQQPPTNQTKGLPEPTWASLDDVAMLGAEYDAKKYDGMLAYTRSKLCNVLMMYRLARDLKAKKSGVTVAAFDPGAFCCLVACCRCFRCVSRALALLLQLHTLTRARRKQPTNNTQNKRLLPRDEPLPRDAVVHRAALPRRRADHDAPQGLAAAPLDRRQERRVLGRPRVRRGVCRPVGQGLLCVVVVWGRARAAALHLAKAKNTPLSFNNAHHTHQHKPLTTTKKTQTKHKCSTTRSTTRRRRRSGAARRACRTSSRPTPRPWWRACWPAARAAASRSVGCGQAAAS